MLLTYRTQSVEYMYSPSDAITDYQCSTDKQAHVTKGSIDQRMVLTSTYHTATSLESILKLSNVSNCLSNRRFFALANQKKKKQKQKTAASENRTHISPQSSGIPKSVFSFSSHRDLEDIGRGALAIEPLLLLLTENSVLIEYRGLVGVQHRDVCSTPEKVNDWIVKVMGFEKDGRF